jgi:hypothetical protein
MTRRSQGKAAWSSVLWLSVVFRLQAFEWHAEPGCRWADLAVPTEGRTGFTLLAPERTGVGFTNHLAETTSALNRVFENGSGVALGDVDGDGWCDVYLCRLEGDNVLYRNLGGWTFADITRSAGVACPNQYSTGAVFADVDGDGDLDLLVNAIGGGTREFLNDGQGQFSEVKGSRLVRRFGSTSMALADIDGDGDLDLYVTNYRVDTYLDEPPGLNVEVRMVDGRLVVTPEDRFIPIVQRAGGVELMEKGDRDFLYLNDGQGRFAPVSWTSGSFLDEDGQPLKAPPTDWGLSVVFRDLNGDGTPDIYVCNDFFFFPDRIWVNEGGRGFRAIDRFALRQISVSSMGMDAADINRDGFDDLYVTDMVSRSHAWRQRQRPNLMKGIVRQAFEDPAFRPEVSHNCLFLNRGDGTYAEIAQLAGVDFTEWSWGAVFLDVDLDGYEDLLVPTGNNHDVQDADVLRARARRPPGDSLAARLQGWRQYPVLATPILAYRNNRDLTFQETGTAWGFGAPGPWHGMALADLDNDGDLDGVVNRLNGAAGVYRNETAAPRLAVRLKGVPPNTRGIGAKVRVEGGPVNQSQEMMCGGRYESADESVRVFAAGSTTNRLRIEVTWRSGRHSVVDGAQPNRIYEIAEGSEPPGARPDAGSRPVPAPWFADVSPQLGHRHASVAVDEFARQPLLSRKLSESGPGIAWFDLDGDGWDDLLVGAGEAGTLAAFRNDGKGGFTPMTNALFTTPHANGQGTVLGCRFGTAGASILAGIFGWNETRTGTNAVEFLGLGDEPPAVFGSAPGSSIGPLALADVDGDGHLDLFVGGRVRPGRYPEAAASRLYRVVWTPAGTLQLDRPAFADAPRLASAGMVSGAVFSDLDADGFAELILACDWGPIRIFRNDRGRLTEWNPRLIWRGDPATDETRSPEPNPSPANGESPVPGSARDPTPARPPRLDRLTGWWNGVTTGDFDGDGRLDLVVSGWGRNTRFQRFLAKPLRVYYGDLSGAGDVDLVEAYFEPEQGRWVAWRDYDTMTRAFPFLADTVPTFRAYGETGVESLLGDRLQRAKLLEAAVLESLVLLNRGEHFEVRPLPLDVQFSPAFGVAVGDFDADGREDVFLSQNFFGVEEETARYDGGLGLWLRGDGRGDFEPVTAGASGIRIHGQQRGCAVADFDADGRLDLAVAQHNDSTKLFRNARGAPGLRIRLKGPAGNPQGIGAVLRLKAGAQSGPAREVHAGSGYWSQDSAVQVVARPRGPAALDVRWPGGKRFTVPLPDAREIEVDFEGRARALR